MVSVTSASRYIMSASHNHPRYQSRSSMCIRGLIPRNFAEFAEAVPITDGTRRQKVKETVVFGKVICVSGEARTYAHLSLR